MKITLIQTQLYWEDREKNISNFNRLIVEVKGSDVIVLPEMFTTGFTMAPHIHAEPADGDTLAWMREKAAEKKAVVTGSVSVKEGDKYFNRLYWVEPGGGYQFYNKRHLFRMGKEDEHYTAGNEKIIATINGWKFCPLVCYDLRFPVWSRNRFRKDVGMPGKKNSNLAGEWDYDVLLYVSNWPEVRSHAYKQLLIARAIENQCYVVAVNRVGKDVNGYNHSGESIVIGPKGEIINRPVVNNENVETITLELQPLNDFRAQFPVGFDADNFTLH